MNVADLARQLSQMVENGYGQADVFHVNGTGKETLIRGFEVVERASYDEKPIENVEASRKLRLITHPPF